MIKASKSFLAEAVQINQLVQLGPVWILVIVQDGASTESADEFCYLGDMLSVDRDADAAVKARVPKRQQKSTLWLL